MKTSINDLMQHCGVGFGTSGARGLVKDMSDRVCYAYTLGFIQYLKQTQQLAADTPIAIAGDLRASTPRIMNACARAIQDSGLKVINCAFIPTPAVALYGLKHQCPVLMVTGSHIPDDRNGIKFYKLKGEILKVDELLIKEQAVQWNDHLFNEQGAFSEDMDALGAVNSSATEDYLQRYQTLFPENALAGKRIGVYQHSGVAREMIPKILAKLGAEVICLGFSRQFIPVDTEAVRAEDIALGQSWSKEYQLDAIVSTDGDADRPLIADEYGHWLRGDIVGILCAQYLHIDHLVTPVSSNTCVEKSSLFAQVKRTRIGSPYVIEAMDHYIEDHYAAVAGYEANGGFLLATPVRHNDSLLTALPTRDALIVLLTLLHSTVENNCTLSELKAQLPQRFTYSDRLKDFASQSSQQLLAKYTSGSMTENKQAIEADFPQLCKMLGPVKDINTIDGLRISFENEDIIHFRPSGNAPEFRCYSESNDEDHARQINQAALQRVRDLG